MAPEHRWGPGDRVTGTWGPATLWWKAKARGDARVQSVLPTAVAWAAHTPRPGHLLSGIAARPHLFYCCCPCVLLDPRARTTGEAAGTFHPVRNGSSSSSFTEHLFRSKYGWNWCMSYSPMSTNDFCLERRFKIKTIAPAPLVRPSATPRLCGKETKSGDVCTSTVGTWEVLYTFMQRW